MAEQTEMSVDDHDRLMAYVLGLSHALNLAFFTALAASGELVPRLQRSA
jgi:chorismate mutase/prephenate dehydrogenase